MCNGLNHLCTATKKQNKIWSYITVIEEEILDLDIFKSLKPIKDVQLLLECAEACMCIITWAVRTFVHAGSVGE